MFLSQTAPCSFHWGLSMALNQWSCAIVNFDLWGCFCFELREEGVEMRERTGNTTLIRWAQDELKSLKVWLRFTEAAHHQRSTFFYSLGYKYCSAKVRLKIEMPPHCRETWRGGMRGEERRRKLAQGSVVTALSAKAWGDGEAGGKRPNAGWCTAEREEREGGQEKVKNIM